MPAPARDQWWDKVVKVDSHKLNKYTYLLWGDRVRVLSSDGNMRKIAARGTVGTVHKDILGDEPLLELYFIDVGQGDGILVVTPEGHHLLVDGGLRRNEQQTRKSAADFVDWKFHKDYLPRSERGDSAKNQIRLDAMIASHADIDHYGGLRDLVDREVEESADELSTEGISVELFYHPGLCPQVDGTDKLGEKKDGFFVELLGNRDSAIEGLKPNPVNAPRIRGEWKKFIEMVTRMTTKAGDHTPFKRLSQNSGFLDGFADTDNDSEVTIRVLGPIEQPAAGTVGLRDLGDEGYNKNGHSVALRLQYKNRSILLTGDLNEKAQADIIDHYDSSPSGFASTWRSDVAKACHHGSHHVRYDFLEGVNALSTVFSSGDANTYDHPRAWVLGAAALSGRVIEDPDEDDRLKAPLIYSTEVARSLSLKGVDQIHEYEDKQKFGKPKVDPVEKISGAQTLRKWRVVLDRDSDTGKDYPPAASARVMRNVIYGLVNVRTDGDRLLFAVRNEGNASWSYETMEATEIANAYKMKPDVTP